MKSISVSDELHKKIMDRKTSVFKSADLVIGWMIEQEKAIAEHNEACERLQEELNLKLHSFDQFDEGDLLIKILNSVDVLTCINCGERLIDSRNTVETFDKLGTIHLDPGSRNYPHEPDEPAGIYFECVNCAKSEGSAP